MKLIRPPVPVLALLPVALALALSAPAQNPPPSPATPPAGALAAAKVAEEGDGDSDQAARQYQDIVQRYDASRSVAAEALFRLAEIARNKGSTAEANQLHLRLSSEFQGAGDFAKRSEAILRESRPSPRPRMSPELMRRYGLGPEDAEPTTGRPGGMPGEPAAEAEPPATLPAALRARYGLGPSPASAPQPPAPTTRLVTDPTTGFSYDPTAHAVSIDPNTGNPVLVPSAPAADVWARAEALALRSEIAGVARQIRKVHRELSAAKAAGPKLLSAAFVSDTQLLRFLADYDQARIKFNASNDAKAEQPEVPGPFLTEMNRAESQLISYFHSPYLERLETTLRILSDQKADLELERTKLEAKPSTAK